MVELGGHNSPVSLLDVANEKKSSSWSPASRTGKRGLTARAVVP